MVITGFGNYSFHSHSVILSSPLKVFHGPKIAKLYLLNSSLLYYHPDVLIILQGLLFCRFVFGSCTQLALCIGFNGPTFPEMFGAILSRRLFRSDLTMKGKDSTRAVMIPSKAHGVFSMGGKQWLFGLWHWKWWRVGPYVVCEQWVVVEWGRVYTCSLIALHHSLQSSNLAI